MNMVTSIVKQPFLDLRLAAYQLLCVMADQPWGRAMIMKQPGFCEFLMDRSGEKDKRGRQGGEVQSGADHYGKQGGQGDPGI